MRVRPFIAVERAEGHSVARCCELLEVSRAAYYQDRRAIPSARACSDAELATKIKVIYDTSKGAYGAPMIHAQLAKDGVHVGRKRVARLMVAGGMAGRCTRRWRKTTIADPDATDVDDLIKRDFAPRGALDTRYSGDITYIWTWEGWAYLATVIDLASRKVVGWALGDHMRASLVGDALSMAAKQREPAPGVIFHSDRGSQYTSKEFANLAASLGVRLSRGRKGECWDNAVSESWFSSFKAELIESRSWPTLASLRTAVFDYIEGWYNTRRLHSSLGYCSPCEYEADLQRRGPVMAVCDDSVTLLGGAVA